MDDLQAAWSSLSLALLGAGTLAATTLGAVGVSVFRSWQRLNEKRAELTERDLELKRLEVDEKIRAIQRASALDAASIAQETSYGGDAPLSGYAKASLAADKLRELEPSLASADRSTVTDLVKLGAARLRSQSGSGMTAVLPQGTYLISASQAPAPEHITTPARLPPPAALPQTTLTKTSPERPGAKR